ncbi:hypothetical protein DV735_g2223, partial [Chaetothyriales sp. CBS 134920]
MDDDDSTSSMSMAAMVFTTSHTTPLYSNSWTPTSAGGYAGTCIFLILLGVMLRLLIAVRSVLEQRWAAQARNRRYVVVVRQDGSQSTEPEAERIENDPDAKLGSLITAQGVEERVKVVTAVSPGSQTAPFRLSVDVPRAFLVLLITGVGYLL